MIWICGIIGVLFTLTVQAMQPLEEQLRRRMEALPIDSAGTVDDERIHTQAASSRFYLQRAFHPAWWQEGKLSPRAEELLELIDQADREGLNPEDYHLGLIRERLTSLSDPPIPSEQVDLELLLTDAYFLLASHSLAGHINPVTIDPEWFAERRGADYVAILEEALNNGSIEDSLRSLLPTQNGYWKLRQVLEDYRQRQQAGPWPQVPTGSLLRPGESDARVINLRQRLATSGEYRGADLKSRLYDDELQSAVVAFQQRHGLKIDGIVGPTTLAMLNVSLAERIRQLEVNLERWRWLPQDLGRHHILVNIANFSLEVVRDAQTQLEMRVIVGKSYRRTPVFSGQMRYLVLNPRWEVPHKIAVMDILPQVQADPEYLTRLNFRVLQGWGADAQVVDPLTVNWTELGRRKFPYRLQQAPGPLNALGQVKFMFPNPHDVYLHDTPKRELFKETLRTFSSGCIRLENPVQLAEHLLAGTRGWSPERLVQALEGGVEQTVPLATPVPVHLLYWTAWVGADDVVQFRQDIYGRDQRVALALAREAPEVE